MKVSRLQIVTRGLTHRCPNCGGRTLFREGSWFRVNPECRSCGLRIEREEGGNLGSLSLIYGVTVVCFLTPVAVLRFTETIGTNTAVALAFAFGTLVPVVIYRPARSWWLMNYYLVLPQHLPANQREVAADEDGNT